MDLFTLIEIVQIVCSGAGVIFSIRSLRHANKVRRLVDKLQIGNGRRIIAEEHVSMEVLRLAVQGTLFASALIALVMLPTPPSSMPNILVNWVIVRKLGYSLVTILLLLNTLHSRYIHSRLVEEYDVDPKVDR